MAVCASDASLPVEVSGCVALATSTDLEHWTVHPPLVSPGDVDELECPVLERLDDGSWLLLGSIGATRGFEAWTAPACAAPGLAAAPSARPARTPPVSSPRPTAPASSCTPRPVRSASPTPATAAAACWPSPSPLSYGGFGAPPGMVDRPERLARRGDRPARPPCGRRHRHHRAGRNHPPHRHFGRRPPRPLRRLRRQEPLDHRPRRPPARRDRPDRTRRHPPHPHHRRIRRGVRRQRLRPDGPVLLRALRPVGSRDRRTQPYDPHTPDPPARPPPRRRLGRLARALSDPGRLPGCGAVHSVAARARAASRTAATFFLPCREPFSLALMCSRTVTGS